MRRFHSVRIWFTFAVLSWIAAAPIDSHGAQTQTQDEYKPWEGQPGKDVIWAPTTPALVDQMLEMAQVTPNDYVVDLGSGDGRIVIAAAKRGANALGIEYNPDLVGLSNRKATKEGVSDKAHFIQADLFEIDFSKATVLTLFLSSNLNLRLRSRILEMRPGTRIVSNSFAMGEWKPDQEVHVEGDCHSFCTAYLWIVPAKIKTAK